VTTARRDELWHRLAEAGLVQGDVPAPADARAPWFVRAMLGVAGWIGAMFFLGFAGVGFAFVFRSGGAALGIGALCCAAAYIIFRRYGRHDLATQFGLAVSIAGQSMFIFGLNESGGFDSDDAIFWILMAVFQAAITALLGNFVNRVLSATAGAVAIWIAMYKLGLFGLPFAAISAALAVLWLNEGRWSARGELWRPVGYGLTFTLLLLPEVMNVVGGLASTRPPILPLAVIPWVHRILMAAVFIYLVHQLLARNGVQPSSTAGLAALGAAVAVSIATMKAGGVAAALLVLMLGFARGNRALLGLGIVGMLGHLSYFYYSLEMTLLAKSGALIAAGVTLVVLWALMRVVFGAAPDTEPASA
jgi:hypothetical protein